MKTHDRYYFTRDGLERLRLRVAEARAAFRAVCDDNPAAAEAGDNSVWHDNFAYEDNQRKMQMLARRVRELETVLESAVVVTPEASLGAVALGSRVHYCFEDDPTERACVIAGFDDGDVRTGRVAYNSPFGSQLLGARAGDAVEVRLAGRTRVLELLRVGLPDEEGRCEA